MPELTLPSFAKINWILKVLGRRPDGFHELRTVFQTLELGDELRFRVGSRAGIRLKARGLEVPQDESNLVWKAAESLRPFAPGRAGAGIALEKRVPLGAGLGGGSSNAAVTLLALNQLWDCRLGAGRLAELAARLGSDVPFFLTGGTVAGGGRGDVLLALPDLPFRQPLLLCYPRTPIPAGQAYAMRDWGRFEGVTDLTSLKSDTTIQRFCRAARSREKMWAVLENDFERPLYASRPPLERARAALVRAGCGRTLVSGSGSTVAGLTRPAEFSAVREAARRLAPGRLIVCGALSRRQYWKRLKAGGLRPPGESQG